MAAINGTGAEENLNGISTADPVDKLDLAALKSAPAASLLLSVFGGSTFVYVDGDGDGGHDAVVILAGNATTTTADILFGPGV